MRLTIVISLVLAMTASAFADTPPAQTERRRSRVVAAWTFTAIGGVFVASSVGLGYAASRKYHAAFEDGRCEEQTTVNVCNASGLRETRSAKTMGNIATGFGLAGLGLIGTAAIVYFTAPRDAIAIAPTASSEGGGFVVSGRF